MEVTGCAAQGGLASEGSAEGKGEAAWLLDLILWLFAGAGAAALLTSVGEAANWILLRHAQGLKEMAKAERTSSQVAARAGPRLSLILENIKPACST
jgi:hypothetical protein